MKEILDGNQAVSKSAYLFTEVAAIYPITPSSPMANNIDILSSKNEKNLYNSEVKVYEMESEAGAAGALHGALLSGSLATTFTASQGLLLMIPNMYKIAGEGLPGVIHVASRTLATHALSIFGDHSDIYAVRQTGWAMLSSSNNQDAYLLSAVSHLSAIEGSIPFIHFFDGFRTSHEINVVNTLDNKELTNLVNKEALEKFKEKSLNIGKEVQYGMNENEDIYFQSMEARSGDYNKIPDIVNSYMKKINKLAGTDYKPFNYYGSPEAENIIIAMGSVTDTIKNVIDHENKLGNKYGLINVHLYRPFSTKYLLDVLPNTVKNIAVLDRTKEFGSIGEPLYLDVVSALKDKNINIVGGRYGLSSKNTTPNMIKAIYTMLETNPTNNFTIGIEDDLNNTSLKIDDNYKINTNYKSLKIYGFGSDGMVSASKDIMHLIGDTDKYVQGYFEYDSKKSGGVTISHLRFSDEYIRAPYYVNQADILVVTKDNYFSKFNILKDLKENSTLIINTNNIDEVLSNFTKEDFEFIQNNNIKLYEINADKIAENNHISGKISKIMESIILRLLTTDEDINNNFINSIREAFKLKGEDIVNNNINAVEEAKNSLNQITINDIPNNLKDKNINSIIDIINAREGNTLKTSDVLSIKNGAFKGALTRDEKRNVALKIPKWNSEKCVQCGKCAIVCPHAAIRPFLVKSEEGLDALGAKDYKFIISISTSDCMGCGLCADACDQGGIELVENTTETDAETKELFNNYKNPEILPKFSIKGSQLQKPKFEFSGACAGCGEAAYIKLLTQLYGDEIVIANATGCSSIYGGSVPSTPYSLPWANSLFEDNAEFAYGMHISFKNKRDELKKAIFNNRDKYNNEIEEDLKDIYNNYDNYSLVNEKSLKIDKNSLPEEVKNLYDYIKPRTVVAIGGDGWAYDIGFNGIDHILSSGENIKVLVLDTEVYSNTGGQMSKSSHVGQVAEFASTGKKGFKKDLFRIAMSYPNCYVASICLGSNPMQSIKSMKEAFEHQGPAIIIAYSPCIEHGIKGGMSCSLKEQKLAVDSGYVLLMRYNPDKKELSLDSKEPNFELYDEFLSNEVRYRSLKMKNKEQANDILNLNKEVSIERYNYYKELINKEN